jgi:[acyl-carrier-protein] S-malonyltransferase
MSIAYIFPGQGAQFTGMGKDLYDSNTKAKEYFEQANDILGFDIASIMFYGSDDDLKKTQVTQPAVFLHSVIKYMTTEEKPVAQMVAGHSLGEFSALVANGVLRFEDGLQLVFQRAQAMQMACEKEPSTMAAVLGLADDQVEEVCNSISEVVVAANYNCPGQLVISGSIRGIELAAEALKNAGAKRVLPLQVGGAFHSPLMEPARELLASAIQQTSFHPSSIPVYQNINALPFTDANQIKQNLIDQLTGPVRWTQIVENMVNDGANQFIECGPGKVLQGLVKKISSESSTLSL